MPSLATLALFGLAAVALAVVPGPAVAYIVTQSVDRGRRAGIVSAFGIASGGLVHVAAATVGLSALIASSAAAFTVVKLVGATYLIAVGVRRILTREEPEAEVQTEETRLRRLYGQGVVVNVLNPKTALFFLAFLPQFVDPSRGAAWAQVMVLGAVFVVLGLCTDGAYALLSGTAGGWLRRKSEGAGFRRGPRYVSGGVYLALGAATAVSGSGKD
jgi:threonine/homoserine/homoserine lactone efflux protein